jgi:hypothetical protein
MNNTFKAFDKFVDQFTAFGTNLFAWLFWVVFLFVMLSEIGNRGFSVFEGNSAEGVTIFLVLASVWLWGTIRWLRRRGYLSKISSKPIPKASLLRFVLTSVVAPILISLVIHFITGSSSVTILSIPLFSYLSANIGIG